MSQVKAGTKSFTYSIFVLMSSNIVMQLIVFLYRVFLSRAVGAETIGLFSLVTTIYSIACTIIVSGLPTAVMRISSERTALGDPSGVRQTVNLAIKLVALISLLVAAAVFLFARPIALFLGDLKTELPLRVLSFCILITGFENVLKSYFYSINRVLGTSFIEPFEQLVRMLAVFLMLHIFNIKDQSLIVTVLVLAMIIGEAVSGIFLFSCYFKTTGIRHREKQKLNFSPFFSLMQIALPLTLTRVIASVIGSVNSIIVPKRLIVWGLDYHKALQSYGILSGMIMPLIMLPFTLINALSIMIIPKLSGDMATSNMKDIQNKIAKSIFFTAVAIFPCMAALMLLGERIGFFLYHQPMGKGLFGMSVCILFQSYQLVFSSVLNGIGKQKRASAYTIVGGLVQFGLTYVLTAKLGIAGFIISFLIASVLTCGLLFAEVIGSTKMRVRPLQWFLKPLLATVIMANIAAVIFRYAASQLSEGSALGVTLLAGVCIYMLALWAQGVRRGGNYGS